MNDGETRTLDFREKASRHAHRDLYLDPSGNVIPRLSLDGHLAAGVPGTVHGMVELHQWKGSLSWKELIQPSIDLADRKSTRLNSSHVAISYAVFCLKKKIT